MLKRIKSGYATNLLFDRSFISILILSVVIRLIWIFSVIERDEGGIGIIALQWIEGFPPYIYSLNNSGPLADLIYSFSTYTFGPNIIPIRMINNVLFFLSVGALFLLTAHMFGKKVALCSSFFYGVFMSAPIYEGQLALTSSLSAAFVVFSIYFYCKYIKYRSKKELFKASFLFGCATLIKVHLVLGMGWMLIVILVNFLIKSNQSSTRKMLGDSTIAIAGFSILPVIFFAYFWSLNAIDDIFHIFFELTILGRLRLTDVPLGITLNVGVQGLPLWMFSSIGLVATFVRVRASNRRTKIDVLPIEWLILTGILAAFPPHFGHRYIYLLAPASVLAGIGLVVALEKFRREQLRLRTHRLDYVPIASLFLVILLSLSFVPAIYFQNEQYPQYHIFSESLNFEWRYADADSYETQVNLGQFLRNNTSKDDEILVHGWSGTIYYLANRLPPSIYVWTVMGRGVDIPEDEYNRLVEKVTKLEFRNIVFFDASLPVLFQRSRDPIVEQTLRRYFFIDNIGNALIFGKFNKLHEYKYFSFIENLPFAVKTYYMNGINGSLEEDFSDEPIFIPVVRSLQIDGEKATIYHHPVWNGNSSICYSLYIPKRSTLQFGICIDPAVWEKQSDGVEFGITIRNQEKTKTIFSRYVDSKNVLQDRKLLDFRLNLDEFAGNNALICFTTSPGSEGNAGFDWAHWIDPVLLVSSQE